MPASYPSAVKTFASRSNGTVIDASHVQDLQDEVTSIEDGILNGTAPITSSHITATGLEVSGKSTLTGALQVAGASTFATTVQITGNCTIAGSLTVSGNSTFTGNVNFTGTVTGAGGSANPAAILTHSANSAVAAGTWVGLNWDTETLDTDGMHSTSANSSRITFAGSTGTYAVHVLTQWPNLNSSGYRSIQVFKNDTTVVRQFSEGIHIAATDAGSSLYALALQTLVQATSTADYITIRVRYDSVDGSTSSIQATSTSVVPALEVYRVRS